MKTDCIYYQDLEKSDPGHCECTHRGYYCNKSSKDDMCSCCRLWDAYIPKNSTPAEIEKAQKWQNLPTDEQPDYYNYF